MIRSSPWSAAIVDLLRHGLRPGLASHTKCGRVADKTRRHLDTETADTSDYALIPLSV